SSVIIEEAKRNFGHLENAQFLALEKIELPLKDETIDVVYSNDLIEHLHPSDAFTHFQEIWRVLKKGGKYYFWTPGSRSGPHDFTGNFCPKGAGILSQASHIKEYDLKEVSDILKMSKYSNVFIPDNTKEVLLIAEK
ncbi:MAG: class I SAM-dependent methyltransferase, partial [Nitrospirales bacterium]